jgi:hypothetical protein
MFNPLGEFKPQNPFEDMPEMKNPLDWGDKKDGENEDNLPVFKGLKNPFEEDEEYGDD